MQENSVNSGSADKSKTLIDEAHLNLEVTKKRINELLDYKRSLAELGDADPDKIKEIKSRALEAINNLFDETNAA